MKKWFDDLLFENQNRMRSINQSYVYAIHLVQSLLNIMPPFIRNTVFRLMLRRSGLHTYFDYNLYIQFPWLVEMGNNVSINRGAQFFSSFKGKNKIIIGSDVLYIVPNVGFFAGGHDLNDLSQITGGDIVIGNHVWIGAGAIILPGVMIGDSCVIGAGSVVTTRDIPPNSIAAGNPARIIRTRMM